MDPNTQLSNDLYTYFLLEVSRRQDQQKKLGTLAEDREFDTQAFVKTLSTNFEDLHLTERRSGPSDNHLRRHGRFVKRGRGGDSALATGVLDEFEAIGDRKC